MWSSVAPRVRVGVCLPGTAVKAAEFTVGDADICMIKMAVDVVIRRQTVLLPANGIGELA